VLLVWKPVESCGPVTYIVQCCIEGIGFLRLGTLKDWHGKALLGVSALCLWVASGEGFP
jgi:hypothetical protein